ncbi:hypothetical protein BAUCODRAFT_66078 [Baudoinia panamericana UAMH 10762]|uniref:Acyltransferase MbtK/IucB-like conserved domain-containing protein n=1 Tax=Baudoinia panamericana (strain UAMH 10762) TaxID=717646 RepID=M2N3I2_BAUPA|nr:uncharacterized protein BAUCODRAFT_66078 [Baudoinia panamericana UAMH 10762]EMC98513.1 hypothetical protein BAUCODRAFT_66078 [Baudoinia panamericana UAMH 10762]
MAPSIVHLPNGQTLTVTPVFGGIQFRANDLNTHHNAFPPGWTIVINSEDDEDDHVPMPSMAAHTHADPDATPRAEQPAPPQQKKQHHIHRFRKPSLRNDHMFISSISYPPTSDFRPATSATRQIAMMLWATLWWYFHQPRPAPYLLTPASAQTPEEGRPKADWRVNVNREGIFKGKHLLPKLERMGLIASEDSSVGLDPDDGVTSTGEAWTRMFVSQRTFWQLDARIYLFTIAPQPGNSPYPSVSVSPAHSRPSSPSRNSNTTGTGEAINTISSSAGLGLQAGSAVPSHLTRSVNTPTAPPGPFTSSSHLPTFYPPPPPQFTFTNGIRHPIRPKPPRQGETFYTRYIPSLGQYLSFRVASLSKTACPYRGPTSENPTAAAAAGTRESLRSSGTSFSDSALLHKWMNDPRVSHSWGEHGPIAHQEAFLKHNLASRHSIPVIGCFDGHPFGYFEIYWVKEDRLSAHLGNSGNSGGGCGDWDRGLHVLVGEQEFRGQHRVRVWLSGLVHYCWLADLRTGGVLMEPRVDNGKLRRYCEDVGFYREKEVAFPHKQSNLMRIQREAWEAPAL